MYIKKVVLTKKSNELQKKQNVYTFLVAPNLNKNQIKNNLLTIFPQLKIKKVRTIRYKPAYYKYAQGGKKIKSKVKKKALVELFDKDNSFFSSFTKENENSFNEEKTVKEGPSE